MHILCTFEGVGRIKVNGGLLIDCQMWRADMRRRRSSIVLRDLSSDHLLSRCLLRTQSLYIQSMCLLVIVCGSLEIGLSEAQSAAQTSNAVLA